MAKQLSNKLVITSSLVVVEPGGNVSFRCSKCQRVKPLKNFGFRLVGTKEKTIRNQPQCNTCRSAYKQ